MNPSSFPYHFSQAGIIRKSCQKAGKRWKTSRLYNCIYKASSQCIFLDLPVEIRLIIYEFLPYAWKPRIFDSCAFLDAFRFPIGVRRISVPRPLPYRLGYGLHGWVYTERTFEPAILSSCRMIYQEAVPILYRQLTVHARFSDSSVLMDSARTLENSPFRYIRSFEFSILTLRLSELSRSSLTALRQALEGLPYLEKIGDLTIWVSTLGKSGYSSSMELDVVIKLAELNEGCKPISHISLRGQYLDQERFLEELKATSIPVSKSQSEIPYRCQRWLKEEYMQLYAVSSASMRDRISKLSIFPIPTELIERTQVRRSSTADTKSNRLVSIIKPFKLFNRRHSP